MKFVPMDHCGLALHCGSRDKKKMDRCEIYILEVELIGHDYELKWEVRQRNVKFYSWFT